MKKHLLALALLVLPACAQAALPSFRHLDAWQVREMVADEADAQGISPRLALAVAEVESGFDPSALSSAGARGVMQVMPETAWGEFRVSPDALWDPDTNIRVGVAYLKQLLDTYDGRVDIALSHYNGGSAVRQGNRLRVIPATRSYVEKIMALAGETPSFRAGRILDLDHGDRYLDAAPGRYLNGIRADDPDAHLRPTASGRIVSAENTRTATAFRRQRHEQVADHQHSTGRWVPVARYEDSASWPSVRALRSARAVEGW